MDRRRAPRRIGPALVGAGLAMAVLSGAAGAQQVTSATAELRDGSGNALGVASLTPTTGGVLVSGQFRGLPPGLHGIHIHEVGRCESPFTSAGAHWNPAGRQHGTNNPQGTHASDLFSQTAPAEGSNLRAAANGTGTLRSVARGVTLAPGAMSVFDADGSALVIHVGQDDNVTDPTGNSGDRLACGVIVAGAQALPRTGGPAALVGLAAAGSGLMVLAGLAVRRRRG
jgi:superoxide dismutase, Cu-Zn family